MMENESISDFGLNSDTPSLSGYSESPSTYIEQSAVNWSGLIRYSLIILILAFLGFNLFAYLGKITEETAGFLKPLFRALGYGAATTIKQTASVTAEGAKGIIDVAAGTVSSGVDLLESGINRKGQLRNKIDDDTDLNDALSKSVSKKYSNEDEPIPDDAGSRTQSSKSASKSGFCYIGEDRGFRSCIKVGQADMCMSGDIFPTQEICINPNLRA